MKTHRMIHVLDGLPASDIELFKKIIVDMPGGYSPLGDIKALISRMAENALAAASRFKQAQFPGQEVEAGIGRDWLRHYQSNTGAMSWDARFSATAITTLSLMSRLEWPIYCVDSEFAEAMDETHIDPTISLDSIDWSLPAGMVLFGAEDRYCAGGILAMPEVEKSYSLFEKDITKEALGDDKLYKFAHDISTVTVSTGAYYTFVVLLRKKALIEDGILDPWPAIPRNKAGGAAPWISANSSLLTAQKVFAREGPGDTIATLMKSFEDEDSYNMAPHESSKHAAPEVGKIVERAVMKVFKVLWVTGLGKEHLVEVGKTKRAPRVKKGKIRGEMRHPGFIGRKYVFKGKSSSKTSEGERGPVRLHMRRGHIRNQRYKNRDTGEYYHKPKFIEPMWVGGNEGERDAKLEEIKRAEQGNS